ncbi:MAG: hypothetical protein IJU76_03485 [Desulfovibrionaceae bacterium]|nr:hypothetical protein [Desulfovibrionaceae bacterium]
MRILLLICLCIACPTMVLADDPWVHMPAGARPTYMGIHGGTMPVSLLVSDDGTSLLSFVGRTGNDFIEVLHRTEIQMPSILKETARNATRTTEPRAVLAAGRDGASMPVLVLSDAGYLHKTLGAEQLLPFGFSAKPLSIEGSVRFPDVLPKRKKHYRLFFQPNHLTPR